MAFTHLVQVDRGSQRCNSGNYVLITVHVILIIKQLTGIWKSSKSNMMKLTVMKINVKANLHKTYLEK